MARSWKAGERELARRLGGERVPVSGRTRGWAPDIRHPVYALELKTRKNLPVLLREGMDQAVKAAEWTQRRGEGERLPMLVIHEDGTRWDNAVVVLRLRDARDWFGVGDETRDETA